jgi:GrpB-like predicted nucleotidyltransferase (UPF0157 family)
MPPRIPVELQPHTPNWAEAASREIERLAQALGENLVAIHHVGSTAIPGISAKPILDLMPVVRELSQLDTCRSAVEALGYEWWGEYGLPGRRYCKLTDPTTGRRKVHLHCFRDGTPEVERHLAFRDYAVPGNLHSLAVFRDRLLGHWGHTLRRRSQKRPISWTRILALGRRWLPNPRVLHPYPADRFAASHPR